MQLRILLCLAVVAFDACSTTTTQQAHLPGLSTVHHVDLQRYLGVWYEISAFSERYEKGCFATHAIYSLRADGEVDVRNVCRKGGFTGTEEVAHGRARVVDAASNAKLEVSFFWPFWGDYWIVALGDQYDYAVVGHPSRDHLWILSRTPTMDRDLYASLISMLQTEEYDTTRLHATPQPSATP